MKHKRKSYRWTNADDARALREGWAFFNMDTHPEIQRDDETEIFPSDDDAVSFVMSRSLKGSAFHARALRVLVIAAKKAAPKKIKKPKNTPDQAWFAEPHIKDAPGGFWRVVTPRGVFAAGLTQDDAALIVRAVNAHEKNMDTLRAIKARYDGEWGNPALVKFGALLPDAENQTYAWVCDALRAAGDEA